MGSIYDCFFMQIQISKMKMLAFRRAHILLHFRNNKLRLKCDKFILLFLSFAFTLFIRVIIKGFVQFFKPALILFKIFLDYSAKAVSLFRKRSCLPR